MNAEVQANTNEEGPLFGIQRIYVKDSSFEAPHTPELFREQWAPEVDMNLDTLSRALEDGVHEVVLQLTATVKVGKKVAFVVEVKQAGIFSIEGMPKDQLGPVLGSFCPNILFPYARETISSLVTRGGFPPLYLAPVNFDALYEQHQAKSKLTT